MDVRRSALVFVSVGLLLAAAPVAMADEVSLPWCGSGDDQGPGGDLEPRGFQAGCGGGGPPPCEQDCGDPDPDPGEDAGAVQNETREAEEEANEAQEALVSGIPDTVPDSPDAPEPGEVGDSVPDPLPGGEPAPDPSEPVPPVPDEDGPAPNPRSGLGKASLPQPLGGLGRDRDAAPPAPAARSPPGPAVPAVEHPSAATWTPLPRDGSQVVLVLLTLGLLVIAPFAPFFNHLTRATLHRNRLRKEVLAHVQAHPGVTCADLARALGIHYTTAEYHLRILARFHEVLIERFDGGRRFFESNGKYSPAGRLDVALLRRRGLLEAAAAYRDAGELRVTDLALRLGIPLSTASRRTALLARQGLVCHNGRGYGPTPRAHAVLHIEAAPAARIPRRAASVGQRNAGVAVA